MAKHEARTPLGSLNLGVSADSRGAVSKLLNGILSDENVLLVKTRKAHWDVAGPQFHSLHKLWDDQYTLIAARVDQVAERTRMLGHFPIATMSGWLEHSSLREEPGRVTSATDTVVALTNDHETVARKVREVIGACAEKHHDVGSADLLTGLLRDHELMAWMLRAFVEGEAVSPARAPSSGPPNDG